MGKGCLWHGTNPPRRMGEVFSTTTTEVVSYIEGQEKHHLKKSFREEYLEFLEKFDIDYDLKYVFD